jgi:site-specific DNA recombinase
MERILGAARLSRDSDVSVSIKGQRGDIASVATYRDARVVHVTEDADVSGGKSPFERPGLGPWLTDEALIAQWDVLVVSKLDRLTRSIGDFADLVKWCEKHGKGLVSKAEGIDLTTAAGRMMANVIVIFAQFERERIAERHQQSKEQRRQAGAWTSGRVPLGMTVARDGAYRYLREGALAPVYRECVAMIMRGESANGVARWLTAQGHGNWKANRVLEMLRNPVYAGWLVTRVVTGISDDGKRQHSKDWVYVRDADGQRIRHDAPLISQADFDDLQARLDASRVRRSAPGVLTRLLTSVARCQACGQVLLYHVAKGRKPRITHAYGKPCPAGGPASYGALDTEAAFEAGFLASQGGRRLTVVVSQGENLTDLIAQLETRLADVESEIAAGNMSAGPGARIMATIEADLGSARERHSTEVVTREIDRTFADAWRAAPVQQRNRFMAQHGMRVIVSPDGVATNDDGDLPTLAKFWDQDDEAA